MNNSARKKREKKNSPWFLLFNLLVLNQSLFRDATRLARGLDIDTLPDSSIALSALKLHLAMDVRLAPLIS